MDRLAVLEQVVKNQNEAIKELKAEIEALKATRDIYILIGIVKREISILDLEIQQLNTSLSVESLSSFDLDLWGNNEDEVRERQAVVLERMKNTTKERLDCLVKFKDARIALIEALKAEVEVEEKETE